MLGVCQGCWDRSPKVADVAQRASVVAHSVWLQAKSCKACLLWVCQRYPEWLPEADGVANRAGQGRGSSKSWPGCACIPAGCRCKR